jgi:glycosyltransferase involved in cell wall biosynthesis
MCSPRILYITSGLYFDPLDDATCLRYRLLTDAGFSGSVLCVIYDRRYLGLSIGAFKLQALYLPPALQGYGAVRGLIRAIYYSIYCLYYGALYRKQYDLIAAIDTFKSGTLCYLIKLLTGRPYLIEVMGNYIRSFTVNSRGGSLLGKVKQIYVSLISPIVLKQAGGIKLLYERQLDGLAEVDIEKVFVFHDVTLVNSFSPSTNDRNIILSIGHPWYLKGMDILIRAFNRIHDQIPDYKLHIVGFCDDLSEFEELKAGNPNIYLFNKGMHFEDIIKEFDACSIFVLASRTEAMGRVLLEAMASSKPIIASNVDGIPKIIQHNVNGLLFELEDVEELSESILSLVNNTELSSRLSKQGYHDVKEKFSQSVFIKKYSELINFSCRNS